MITTLQYRKTWFDEYVVGPPNYLRYNKNRKEEICYIFRIRTRCNGSQDCLKERHLVATNKYPFCNDARENERHIIEKCSEYKESRQICIVKLRTIGVERQGMDYLL